jgi:hypothetical protein
MMNKKNTKQQKENLNFIKDWFKRRFNKEPENDLIYFEEWVLRFNTGNPKNFMDNQSLKIYEEMKKEVLK